MNNEVIEKLKATKGALSSYENLFTLFSSTGRQAQPFGCRACFGNVLKSSYGAMDNTYTIYTYVEKNPGNNNLCIFTPEEIREYLAYIADVIPFSFEVSDVLPAQDTDPEGTYHYLSRPHIKIFVHINGPHINHVFILTLIRYLYEHPYKCVLEDVFKLKQVPEFSKISIFNLYNVVAFSIDISSYNMHFSNDMSHYPGNDPVLFMKKGDIKARMEYLTERVKGLSKVASICDIFPINESLEPYPVGSTEWYQPKRVRYTPVGLKFVESHKFPVDESDSSKGERPNIVREFLLEDFWEERLAVYSNNIKILIDATDEQIKKDIEEANKHLTIFNRYD